MEIKGYEKKIYKMLGKNLVMRKLNSKIKLYLKYEIIVNLNLRGD